MDANKTSLSAGEIIRNVLVADAEVMARATKVFPVVADKAVLPYIVYRRIGLEQSPVKGVGRGADTTSIEVLCFAAKYTEGVELAEAVRGVLDGAQGSIPGLQMRSCTMTGSEEVWQDDAFVQQLLFNVKM